MVKSKHTNQNWKQEFEDVTIRLSDLGILKRSPEQQDLQIQSGRVLHILSDTIEKLKIAVSLPTYLNNNACLLRKHFTPDEVEFIRTACMKYTLPQYFSSSKHSKAVEAFSTIIDKIALQESVRKENADVVFVTIDPMHRHTLIDPHIAQVLDMLWTNSGLKEKALAEFEGIVDASPKTLINCIRNLREIAATKLSQTAAQQRSREHFLKKAWVENKQMRERIEELNDEVEKQRHTLQRQIDDKKLEITHYEHRVNQLLKEFKDNIKEKMHESETRMRDETVLSTMRQSELSNESKIVVQQYEVLLSQNLFVEKRLRAKRLKIETQLSSWLSKYDADIGQRQEEYETLEAGYNAEKAEMDALQALFDEQEEEYVVLMGEKEEEEQKIWEEKAYIYLTNRAARRIQRTWRAYRQRKIEKKKAKLARAKAKKEKAASPSGGTKTDKKVGKDKKKKGKKAEAVPVAGFRGPDPMAALEKSFGGDLLSEMQGEEFSKKEVVVQL